VKLVNVRFLNPKFDDAEIIGMDFTDSEVDKADILKARVVCNVKLKDDFIDRDCSQEFKDCELPKYAPKGRICE
jgi:hypothetical protein